MKFVNNLKINWKSFIFGTSMALVMSTTGCNTFKSNSTSITDAISENVDKTCFDEYLENNKDSAKFVDEVTILEQYISLSNTINKLEFERSKVENLDEQELMSVKDLKKLIKNYKEGTRLPDIQREELAINLNIQEKLVNQVIYKDYELIENISLLLVKAKIADALDFSYDKIDKIVLPDRSDYLSYDGAFMFMLDDNLYKVDFKRKSDLDNLIVNVYDMQENGTYGYKKGATEEEQCEYNESRNEIIQEVFDDIRYILEKTAVVTKKVGKDKFERIEVLTDKKVKKLEINRN
jgi:hypothetical protein